MYNYKIFVEVLTQYDAIRNFSVWLRMGSNLADINQFGSYYVKHIIYLILSIPGNV